MIYIVGDHISDLLSRILWIGNVCDTDIMCSGFTIRACGALDVFMDQMIWVSLGYWIRIRYRY